MSKPIDPNLNSDELFNPNNKDTNIINDNDSLAATPENAAEESGFSVMEVDKGSYTPSGHHHSHSSGHSHSHGSHHSHSHHHHHGHHSGSHSKKKKKPLWFRILIIIVAIIFAAAAIVGGTYIYLRDKGQKELVVEPANPKYEETIEYNGHTYIYDKNKVAFAFIGVDRENIDSNGGSVIGNAGQADTDIVGVIDTATGKVSLITIPRDTMVDIDLYSESGEFVRTQNMQLCLSYAYGDGGEKSCKNVTTAISRILGNVPIENYFALDLSGIAPLNDAVGGVTVTSLYDFPQEGIKKGDTITIKGDFAETYVRYRSLDTIDASLNRVQRQTQYIKAYTQQLRTAVTNDFSVVTDLYNTAAEYSQTNISLSSVTYLASVILSHGITDIQQYTLQGEMKPSSEVSEDVFAEYYVDEDSVMEIVVNCFYQQVN